MTLLRVQLYIWALYKLRLSKGASRWASFSNLRRPILLRHFCDSHAYNVMWNKEIVTWCICCLIDAENEKDLGCSNVTSKYYLSKEAWLFFLTFWSLKDICTKNLHRVLTSTSLGLNPFMIRTTQIRVGVTFIDNEVRGWLAKNFLKWKYVVHTTSGFLIGCPNALRS